MGASDLSYALRGLLVITVLLLWFHLGWRRYAIDRGCDEIMMLRYAWWDLVISNPEWHQNAACQAFTRLLEELAESLPTCWFGLAVTMSLTRFRARGSLNVGDAVIDNIPGLELREHARRVLDGALLVVGATMLRQSILALSLVLLLAPAAVIVMLAVTVIRHRVTGLASLFAAVAGGTGCSVASILRLCGQECVAVATRPVLTVVES